MVRSHARNHGYGFQTPVPVPVRVERCPLLRELPGSIPVTAGSRRRLSGLIESRSAAAPEAVFPRRVGQARGHRVTPKVNRRLHVCTFGGGRSTGFHSAAQFKSHFLK